VVSARRSHWMKRSTESLHNVLPPETFGFLSTRILAHPSCSCLRSQLLCTQPERFPPCFVSLASWPSERPPGHLYTCHPIAFTAGGHRAGPVQLHLLRNHTADVGICECHGFGTSNRCHCSEHFLNRTLLGS